MRVWIDLTNSPHVLVMRPVIELLRADGHEVRVTARDFAQTLELCERLGVEHTAIGHHRGGRLLAKAGGLASRTSTLVRWAQNQARAGGSRLGPPLAGGRPFRGRWSRTGGRPFDIALGHGSNDITIAAALLRIPSSTMFDYEWATIQHTVNCRLAAAVVVPDAIPAARLDRYGAGGKIHFYEGLKEEYYLADFEPERAVLEELSLDPQLPLAVVRTPPAVSLYHRFENDLFARVLDRLAAARTSTGMQTVVLPRVTAQRDELRAAHSFVVPEHAVDAQSLIAFADIVISAGGTMNREAVALGTPVFTTFQGRLGALDERLLAEGRMHMLARPEEIPLERRARDACPERIRRDPRELVRLMLAPLDNS